MLAADIICKVGPEDIFPGEKLTVKHFWKSWMSRFSDISSFET